MKKYEFMEQSYHKEAEGIFDGYVVIEEKVDGAQFRIQINDKGEISCASKNFELGIDSMFARGTESAKKAFKGLKADPGDTITIFAEYLPKPKQGRIPYTRTPKDLFVVFDVLIGDKWLRRGQKEEFCFMWNVECVPCLWKGTPAISKKEFEETMIPQLLMSTSYLGHQAGFNKIEGIVVKNYDKLYDVREGHSLYGEFMCIKYVNEEYKEKKEIKVPKSGNSLQALIDSCSTEARWEKALQHCKEQGLITGKMEDLKHLVPEAQKDLSEEEEQTLKDELWKLYKKDILVGATKGMPKWYQAKISSL